MLQEDAGVNHIAAKIIDSISAKPGPHAAVCVDIFVLFELFVFHLNFKNYFLKQQTEKKFPNGLCF